MKDFIIRPLSSKRTCILAEDIIISASSVVTAKLKAMGLFPGAAEYKIIDDKFADIKGLAGLQRLREKSGFGL